jgi:hypothetical protein
MGATRPSFGARNHGAEAGGVADRFPATVSLFWFAVTCQENRRQCRQPEGAPSVSACRPAGIARTRSSGATDTTEPEKHRMAHVGEGRRCPRRLP